MRIPDEPWTQDPVDPLAVGYDALKDHGWYSNLDPLVEALAKDILDGHVLLDYSGGTGILIGRLLERLPTQPFGIINVDASAKFLRLSLEHFGNDPRVAFRLIRYIPEERRLQSADEVVGLELLRGVAGIACANAIHLYYDLPGTLQAWRRVLRPHGRVYIQSGNIVRPGRPNGLWIIDDTVHALAAEAENVVREDDRFAAYRPRLNDEVSMESHHALRNKYFLPVRPLDHYLNALDHAGFQKQDVSHRTIDVDLEEWLSFLDVYSDGILGWVGGTLKLEGAAPSEAALQDRKKLMRLAAQRVFGGKEQFQAEWTYITCEKI